MSHNNVVYALVITIDEKIRYIYLFERTFFCYSSHKDAQHYLNFKLALKFTDVTFFLVFCGRGQDLILSFSCFFLKPFCMINCKML